MSSKTVLPEKKVDVELFEYQKFGAKWLASKRVGLLADEMGIGKTAQAITACDLIGATKILVVCRAVAKSNWRYEFEKFSKYERVYNVIYSSAMRDKTQEFPTDAVNICSYESLPGVLVCGPDNYDVVVVDESHYVKNHDALRTLRVYGKNGIMKKGVKFWCLTGTPMPNHAAEMWTTLYSFGATRMTYWKFVERYCVTKKLGYAVARRGDFYLPTQTIVGSKTDPETIADFKKLIQPYVLRRTKEDVGLELPAISYSTVYVDPGAVNLREHDHFRHWWHPVDKRRELNIELKAQVESINDVIKDWELSDELVETLKAQARSISTVWKYTALQKIEPAFELIKEELISNAYKKIVIFCIHRDLICAMRNRLRAFGAQSLYGATLPGSVDKIIRDFQNPNSRYRVLVCNIHSAGTSINLTVADQVVFMEQAWSPGDNAQAVMRCHRIGQTRKVTVRAVSLSGGIDKKITETLARKSAQINLLLASEKNTDKNVS